MLSFMATPAHKSSRAKWRATHVWRGEDEPAPHSDDQDESPGGSIRGGGDYLNVSSGSIEDEMNEFLPHPDHPTTSTSSNSLSSTPVQPPVQVFTDAQLSGAGVIPIWNFRGDEDRNGGRGATVSVVPESYQMSASALSDLRFIPEFSPSFLYGGGGVTGGNSGGGGEGVVNGQAGRGEIKPVTTACVKVKKYTSVACQTVSTSDIIATQLYQDS